jgi:hypothetical protein
MTEAIEKLVDNIVDSLSAGRSFKVRPALETLPEEDLLRLAICGLDDLVNDRINGRAA